MAIYLTPLLKALVQRYFFLDKTVLFIKKIFITFIEYSLNLSTCEGVMGTINSLHLKLPSPQQVLSFKLAKFSSSL